VLFDWVRVEIVVWAVVRVDWRVESSAAWDAAVRIVSVVFHMPALRLPSHT
jgi:hypothetical protein